MWPALHPKHWRFRLRTLLVVVLVIGLGCGWLARHLQWEREQIALVAELNQAGIYAWQYGPNSAGWVIQALPLAAQKGIIARVRHSFFYSPTHISAFSIRDDQTPYLI